MALHYSHLLDGKVFQFLFAELDATDGTVEVILQEELVKAVLAFYRNFNSLLHNNVFGSFTIKIVLIGLMITVF